MAELLPPSAATLERTGFFMETPGVYSSMRLMSFVSLLAAIGFGLLAMLEWGNGAGMVLAPLFLTAAFTGKLLQRSMEKP